MGQVPSLTITGEPGRDYRIEYTDDLSDTNSFQTLATIHLESSQTTCGYDRDECAETVLSSAGGT